MNHDDMHPNSIISGASLRTQEKNNEITMKVLLYTSKPYLEEDGNGFYYAIWKSIKEKMNTMKQVNSNKSSIQYVFEETFVSGYFLQYDEVESTVYESYDIIVGLFDGLLPYEVRSKGWNVSNPVFIHNSVVVKVNVFNFFKMFSNLFFKKYLPLLLIFLILSTILGHILFRYTKRKSRRNAIWQTLSAMMGEFGYLSEKLSDNYQSTSYFGYFVNIVIFIICLYCFLYIQATINTTMIYANRSSMDRHNPLKNTASDKYLTNLKHIARRNILFNKIDLKDYEDTMHYDATKRLLREYKDRNEERSEYNGLVLDAVMFNHIVSDDSYILGGVAGQMGVGILVRGTDVIHNMNAAIQTLHASEHIRNICKYHMKGMSVPNQCDV